METHLPCSETERFERIEKELKALQVKVTALENMQRDVGEIRKVIIGNGDPAKSHVVAIDRLVTWAASMKKFMWAVGILILGLAVKEAYTTITAGPRALEAIEEGVSKQQQQIDQLIKVIEKKP